MNRPVVDRTDIDAASERRRYGITPAAATEWVKSKAGGIPAAVTGLVNKILHRHPVAKVKMPRSLRRQAGVYVWRPTFGPDGLPDSDGEIVPVHEARLPPRPRHIS